MNRDGLMFHEGTYVTKEEYMAWWDIVKHKYSQLIVLKWSWNPLIKEKGE
jgi:hypothetical protein